MRTRLCLCLFAVTLLFSTGLLAQTTVERRPDAPECQLDPAAQSGFPPRQDICLPPLHFAVLMGDLEQTRRLIARGADVNQALERNFLVRWGYSIGMTPLFYAHDPEIAAYLIKHGADVNFVCHRVSSGDAQSEFTISVLQAAFHRFPVETVKVLLKHGAIPEQERAGHYLAGTQDSLDSTGETPKLELLLSLDIEYDPAELYTRIESYKKSDPDLYDRCKSLIDEYTRRKRITPAESPGG